MNCPRCGQPVEGLACPACTALQSRQAIFEHQAAHLDNLRRGRLEFYAKRMSGKHPWHLMLVGDPGHAWCGAEFLNVGKGNRRHIRYAQLPELLEGKALCLACREALAQMEEAHAIREKS